MTMSPFRDAEEPLEKGWMLEGEDDVGRPFRLGFGETELARAYLGLAIGRHPALCERVLAEESISRRHFRIGLSDGEPFVEDLNSLNGTVLDGVPLPPFRPTPLAPGNALLCGRVRLTLRRLSEPPAGG
jgi:predicted component of type VI protein secretion system